jgi:hypothetical protein
MWWQDHWAELTGLLFVAFQAGGTLFMLRAIRDHLARVNGRLNNHGERIGDLEKSDARRDGAEGERARA